MTRLDDSPANGARLLCVDADPDLADDIAAELGGIAWSGDATNRQDVARIFRGRGEGARWALRRQW